ncbi:hypothetical protein Vretimale_10235 [Volvox reticuliferus]|uniref:Carbohydrate kinase PfkB domain-containing protein n=1 Tax=Volvox reticuliferus TaxID=1737510 RepID=A0A8J4C1Q3_9CHLO|nr:hypothetical protein Vretifemale_724 [Volvox reticuliferus]GIM05764.1 hypothetical protein Vretimale_10235 [Volvox reticuliferus]
MLQIKLHRHCAQRSGIGQHQRSVAFPTGTSVHPLDFLSPQPAQHHLFVSASISGAPVKRRALSTRAFPAENSVDVVGFGNLCVDVVLPVDRLPPADLRTRRQTLDTLTESPPVRSFWEVGGNCNFMVAAARLGLQVASVGHIGSDVYGEFMDLELQNEGIYATTRIDSTSGSESDLDSTLICFVLVDPESRHAFCSRYDFGPWPLLGGIRTLPEEATSVLRSARALFTNGFIFDELPLEAVQAACTDAIQHGAAIFFDPGPRCQTMLEGPRRAALDLLLDLSAVVLMTEEEARVVTGLDDPEAAAQWVLHRPGCRAQWVVVKMGSNGALLCARKDASSNCSSSGSGITNGHEKGSGGCGDKGSDNSTALTASTRLGAIKVEVLDTVGCGDSFAAAVVMGFISGWPGDVTLALANAVGAATATGRGAGRNVARLEKVLELLAAGAAGAASGGPEQAAAFARARELLLQSLAAREERRKPLREQQLSAAA